MSFENWDDDWWVDWTLFGILCLVALVGMLFMVRGFVIEDGYRAAGGAVMAMVGFISMGAAIDRMLNGKPVMRT